MRAREIRTLVLRAAAVLGSAVVLGAGVTFALEGGGGAPAGVGSRVPPSSQVLEETASGTPAQPAATVRTPARPKRRKAPERARAVTAAVTAEPEAELDPTATPGATAQPERRKAVAAPAPAATPAPTSAPQRTVPVA